jgi:hypothetical protein
MGFCCMGVEAGSWAAIRQSEIGTVPARSYFSFCQSIATSGATYKLIPMLIIIGFVGGIAAHFIFKNDVAP